MFFDTCAGSAPCLGALETGTLFFCCETTSNETYRSMQEEWRLLHSVNTVANVGKKVCSADGCWSSGQFISFRIQTDIAHKVSGGRMILCLFEISSPRWVDPTGNLA